MPGSSGFVGAFNIFNFQGHFDDPQPDFPVTPVTTKCRWPVWRGSVVEGTAWVRPLRGPRQWADSESPVSNIYIFAWIIPCILCNIIHNYTIIIRVFIYIYLLTCVNMIL